MLLTIYHLPHHFDYRDVQSFIKKETKYPFSRKREYELGSFHIAYNKDTRCQTKAVSIYTQNNDIGDLIVKTLDGMVIDGQKLEVTAKAFQEKYESSNSASAEGRGGFNKNVKDTQQNVWSIKSTRERSRSPRNLQRDSLKLKSTRERRRSPRNLRRDSPILRRSRGSNSPTRSGSVISWKTNQESHRDCFSLNNSDDSIKRARCSLDRERGRSRVSPFQNKIDSSDNIKQFGNPNFHQDDQRLSGGSNFISHTENDNLIAPPSRWDKKEWPLMASKSNIKSNNSASELLFLEKFLQAHTKVVASQSTGITEAQKVEILKASKTLEPFSPFIHYYSSEFYRKIFERLISLENIYGKHVTECSGEKIQLESSKKNLVEVHKRKENYKDSDEPPEKKSASEAHHNKDKETTELMAVPQYYYVNQVMVDPITGSQGYYQIPIASCSQNQAAELFYYGHKQTMSTESLISPDGTYAVMADNAMMQQAILPYYYGGDQMVIANQDVNVSNDQSNYLESDDDAVNEHYASIEEVREAKTKAADYLTKELMNKFRINDLPKRKKNLMALQINANMRKEFDRMFGENCQTNSHDIIVNYELRHDIHYEAELINAIHLTSLQAETRTDSSREKSKKLVRELTSLEKKAVDDEIGSLIDVARNAFLDPFNEVEDAMGDAVLDRGILDYLKEAIKENVVARIMGLNVKLQVKLDFKKKQKPKGSYLNEFLRNFGLVSLKHVSHSCVAEINFFRHLDKLCSLNATKIGGVDTFIRPVLYGGSPIKLSRKIAVNRRNSFFKGPLLKQYDNISRKYESGTTNPNIGETATENDKVKPKTDGNDNDNDDVEIIDNCEIVDLRSDEEMGVEDMELEDSEHEEISNEMTTDQPIIHSGSIETVQNEKEDLFGDQISNIEKENEVMDTANVISDCQETVISANECQNNKNNKIIIETSYKEQPVEDLNENIDDEVTVEIGNTENLTNVDVEFENNTHNENVDSDNYDRSKNGDITVNSEYSQNNVNKDMAVKSDFVTEYPNTENLKENEVFEKENIQDYEINDDENENAPLRNSKQCVSNDTSETIGNNGIGETDNAVNTSKSIEISDDDTVGECQDDRDVEKSENCQDTESVECRDIEKDDECQNESLCTDSESQVNLDSDENADDFEIDNDETVGESDDEVTLMETTLSSNQEDQEEEEDETEDSKLDPNHVEEWRDMWTKLDDNLEDY